MPTSGYEAINDGSAGSAAIHADDGRREGIGGDPEASFNGASETPHALRMLQSLIVGVEGLPWVDFESSEGPRALAVSRDAANEPSVFNFVQPQLSRPGVQLVAQVADAAHVSALLDLADNPTLAAERDHAVARAEVWLETLGESVQRHAVHDLRLVFIRSGRGGRSGEAGTSTESVTISLAGSEVSMVESSKQNIQRVAKFEPHDTENSGCASWFRQKAASAPIKDPTRHTLVQVYARGDPRRLLGGINLATRFFAVGSSGFVFNEYDKDKEGTLSRTEFAAFVHDLRLAGGNIQRLEDNLRNPGRNSLIGSVLRLTAPETDLVTYVGSNHSLSMWAYKPDPSANLDATAEERLVLTVNLMVWSVAINCVGPFLATSYSNFNELPPLNAVSVALAIIVADSAGQVIISTFFRLKHNPLLQRFLCATAAAQIPECACGCSGAAGCARSIRTGAEICVKSLLRGLYEFTFVRLPVALAVVVGTSMLVVFFRERLWTYAPSILSTLPSARLLEMFKLATVWGVRMQFGAVQGKLTNKSEATQDLNQLAIVRHLSLLEALIDRSSDAEAPCAPRSAGASTSNLSVQERCEVLGSANAFSDERVLNAAVQETERALGEEAAVNREDNAPHILARSRRLRAALERAKQELTLLKLGAECGAIAVVWPPPAPATALESLKSLDLALREDGSGDESESPTCGLQAALCGRVPGSCCWGFIRRGEQIPLVPALVPPLVGAEKSAGAEMTPVVAGGTFEPVPLVPKEVGQYSSGLFLLHRDGKWPRGLANTAFSSSAAASTNEVEVEISLGFDHCGGTGGADSNPLLHSAVSVDEGGSVSPSIFLDEHEWAGLVPRLTARAVVCFPLNPLKALVRDLNTFDERRRVAEAAEEAYHALSREDRAALASSRADLQRRIDEVVALGDGRGAGACRECLPRP